MFLLFVFTSITPAKNILTWYHNESTSVTTITSTQDICVEILCCMKFHKMRLLICIRVIFFVKFRRYSRWFPNFLSVYWQKVMTAFELNDMNIHKVIVSVQRNNTKMQQISFRGYSKHLILSQIMFLPSMYFTVPTTE